MEVVQEVEGRRRNKKIAKEVKSQGKTKECAWDIEDGYLNLLVGISDFDSPTGELPTLNDVYLSHVLLQEGLRNTVMLRNFVTEYFGIIIFRNSESISVQLLEGDRHNPVTFVLRQHKKNSNVPDPTVFVSKTCLTSFKI